jgi:hypothetical protein
MVMLGLASVSSSYAETFDAAREYSCDQPGAGTWYFEAYRHSDGAYLSMVFGHAPITEVSKYGVNAHYLPDGGQAYYPFITMLDKTIFVSPSTSGDKFDAVLAWASPYAGNITATGTVRLMGDIKGGAAAGKRVIARLVLGAKTLWSAEVVGNNAVTFSVKSAVSEKDRLRMHIENAGDTSGDITAVQMQVETTKKN